MYGTIRNVKDYCYICKFSSILIYFASADAEVISLDVISSSSHGKSLIVGVTFLKVKQGVIICHLLKASWCQFLYNLILYNVAPWGRLRV